MRETDTPVDEISKSDKKIADFTARMLNAEEEAMLAMDQETIEQASLRMTMARHFQSKIETVGSKKIVKDIDRKDRKDPIDMSNLALLSRSLKEFCQIMLIAYLHKNLCFEAAQQSFKPSSYKYNKLEKAKAAVTETKLKTWKEQSEMIVNLFSTDPRPELLVSIMVPPDEGTPVSHYLLELDTHISRAQTQKMSVDKLSMCVLWVQTIFWSSLHRKDQKVLYTDMHQSYPDKVREISIERPTYGIMKLADQTFSKRPCSVVKFIPPSKKAVPNPNGGLSSGRDSHAGTGNQKGNKGGDRIGQKNRHGQGADGQNNNVNTKGTLGNKSNQAAEPPKPKYKEVKECVETDSGWRMTQHEPNGRCNGRHAEKCKHYIAKCAECAWTGGYHKHM
ncbi:hypothetical protein SARC_06522 [Sphaeroforma arctica JP610]|uniref:Uncharacterized protein n=1 Tax=Sphaeroforma arctica JP610 TaxID=667725 RepID=A0A0L0FWD6_9EUKA|nr:hypothetical protein SARC_06522 [Sphaeroforma arctica JP610]KNC81140.1 hypothetical protein SARC_06522 [Sphaeroforma arctica JP610]|eukprot:XP_014155042.1 hypothetical protein SARC_06522 [Sphaeroforma arctica JP610]